jgi:hypothetical protein
LKKIHGGLRHFKEFKFLLWCEFWHEAKKYEESNKGTDKYSEEDKLFM